MRSVEEILAMLPENEREFIKEIISLNDEAVKARLAAMFITSDLRQHRHSMPHILAQAVEEKRQKNINYGKALGLDPSELYPNSDKENLSAEEKKILDNAICGAPGQHYGAFVGTPQMCTDAESMVKDIKKGIYQNTEDFDFSQLYPKSTDWVKEESFSLEESMLSSIKIDEALIQSNYNKYFVQNPLGTPTRENIMLVDDLRKSLKKLPGTMPVTIQSYNEEEQHLSGFQFVKSAGVLEDKDEVEGFEQIIYLSSAQPEMSDRELLNGVDATVKDRLFPVYNKKKRSTLREYMELGLLDAMPNGFTLYNYRTDKEIVGITDIRNSWVLDEEVELIGPDDSDCCICSIYLDVDVEGPKKL